MPRVASCDVCGLEARVEEMKQVRRMWLCEKCQGLTWYGVMNLLFMRRLVKAVERSNELSDAGQYVMREGLSRIADSLPALKG